MTNPALKLDPTRLTALAGIARKANSARSGQNEELHDQRDARRELQGRLARVRHSAITGDAAAAQSSAEEAKRLEAELADLSADISVREVELDEIAEAAAAAKTNFKAALKYAKEEGLDIPSALAEEAANV